jgi:hypothetical protein
MIEMLHILIYIYLMRPASAASMLWVNCNLSWPKMRNLDAQSTLWICLFRGRKIVSETSCQNRGVGSGGGGGRPPPPPYFFSLGG